jgi:leucyl aminopeptidase
MNTSWLHKHMGALLAVGQGSLHPSCLITLTYNGGGDKPFLSPGRQRHYL